MKVLALAALAALVSSAAFAQGSHYVEGYTRSNGTYVAPHYQTNPDSTQTNNYSARGNVNPYTGEVGTRPVQPNYGSSYTPVPAYGAQPQQQRQGSSYGQPNTGSSYAPKTCTVYGCF